MKLVVLASGRGTNFAAIAKAVQSKTIPNSEISALICNRPEAGAIEIAHQYQIECHLIDSRQFRTDGKFDRTSYEIQLKKQLLSLQPDYVCLAGYMLIVGADIVRAFPNRIINIHPSLLPSFRGLNAQKQALDFGCRFTGCTVHFVTPELDDGPILAQQTVPIEENDTEKSLCERLLPIEHQTYVNVLTLLATRKPHISKNRVRWE